MMTILIVLAIVLLILGLAGTVYPVMPALPLMFSGAWVLAYAENYRVLGVYSLLILAVVAIMGFVLDFLASLLGAKYTGASKQALWGALLGGLAGAFFGILGLIFAPLVGAALGELLARRDILRAGKVGIGTFIGFIVGTVAKMGAALVMLLIIIWQYWWVS